MTRAESAKAKSELIDARQSKLLKTVSYAERKLLNEIIDKFMNELEISDGTIVSNGKNISLVNAIDKIYKEFQTGAFIDIIHQFTGDMNVITKKNADYFRILDEANNRIPSAEKKANQVLRKQLGINEKGSVVKFGYLDELINDKTILRSVKKTLYNGIAGGKSLESVQKKIEKQLVGDKNINGELTRHLGNKLLDAYQQHDAISGNIFATEIGLSAFIYAGGTIGTSRCFCEKHNGNIYTREESDSWRDSLNEKCGPIWNEDVDGVYVGIERRGGYGCRHSIDWISDSEAIRRRPSLKRVL